MSFRLCSRRLISIDFEDLNRLVTLRWVADTSNIATEAAFAVEMFYEVRLTDLMLWN
jgi:hypothetical protein